MIKITKYLFKGFLIILSILIIGTVLLFLFNSEIRNYALFELFPGEAKYARFLKFANGENHEICLLGTMHQDHWKSKDYSLWHIEAVIDHLRPHLLLIESRPEDLESGNWVNGPLEMLFSNLAARSMGINVDGMDWHEMDPSRFGTTWEERDDRMMQNILKRIPGHRTILILTGYAHVAEFKKRFLKAGFSIVDFNREEKEQLFDTSDRDFLFPQGMSSHIQWGIDNAGTDSVYTDILRKYLEKVNEVGERQ